MSVSPDVTVSDTLAGDAAFTYWPGALKEITGAWLSTSTVIELDVVELPAASVAIACTSYWPSPSEVVLHDAAVDVQSPTPWCAYSNVTAGDGSWLSDALAVSVTVPLTAAPFAGLVSETVGAVRSTNHV